LNKRSSLNPAGYDLIYHYSKDKITETINDEFTNRTFYFEHGNLSKVLSEKYDNHGVLISVDEILFQDFDHNPNPLKARFYLSGAFFRSFSENNYQRYVRNSYFRSPDSTMTLIYSGSFAYPFTYNSSGYPMFGEYE
jgi:hypothetical protein